MKTKILVLIFVLFNCLPACGQKCNIMLKTLYEHPIDFLLKIGDQTRFTSSQGIITINNVHPYRNNVYRIEFQDQTLHSVYENTIHKSKIPSWHEEQLTFASIKLNQLCLNTTNRYYLSIKPLPMSLPDSTKYQPPSEKN